MASKKTKPTASPTQKAEKKRADILKAAGRCFRRSGFHLASMQEICAETELGPGAVYRYFPSKDAIIEAMAEDERRQARALLAALAPGANLDDTLATLSRALFDHYRSVADTGMMTEVLAEGLRNKRVGALVRKAETEWVDGLATVLTEARAAGQLDASIEPRHAALMLTALWDGMIIRHAYHPEDRGAALEASFALLARQMLAPTIAAAAVPPPSAAAAAAKPAPAPAAAAPTVASSEAGDVSEAAADASDASDAAAKGDKGDKADKRPRPAPETPPEVDDRQMSLI